jgi:hypothetical protein
VIAREAPEPALLDLKAYEQPILQALAERGGRATRSEIITALTDAMVDLHSARDLEALPSGPAHGARMASDRHESRLRMGVDRTGLEEGGSHLRSPGSEVPYGQCWRKGNA